jgi:hypothetical protein
VQEVQGFVQELQVHIFDEIVMTDSPVVVHTQSVQQDHRCTQARRLSKLQQDTTAAYSDCHCQPTNTVSVLLSFGTTVSY